LFRTLPQAEQIRRINDLTDEQAQALLYDWSWHGRPNRFSPAGNWTYWLILAGRGFGKTRTGAEKVREWVKKYPLVNLIGATADDARDIMIEGESGILAVCPKDERPTYLPSKRRLEWPNEARSLIFTADEPERLRGKQHMKLWGDEFAAWRYPEAWDQANFGLRLGDNPQAVITTTPKPTKQVKDLARDPLTVITTGTTYDNKTNLAPTFLQRIVKKYEGTRLGRQELNAEILEDNPGAL
jgi:phage terminase large subunit-like protein